MPLTIAKKYFFVLIAIALFIVAISASKPVCANEMFIYQLKYHSAAQVLDAIKPHLAKDTVITAQGNQLIIQSSAEEYKKIQSMLALLDKKPGQYFVEVKILNRKLDTWELQETTLSISPQNSSAKITRYENQASNNGEKLFSLRLTEGYQGFINTGESFVSNQIVEQYGSFIPKSGLKKITSGFYVTINEIDQHQVRIAVSTRSENRQSANTQTINRTSTVNYINGEKDHWILLASINSSESQNNSTRYSTDSSSSSKRWHYIRVKDITQ